MITNTTIVKAGSMVAAGGAVADLIIFNDCAYKYLAVVGAFVSMFGVLHEVLKERPITHSVPQIISEVIKGLVLGVLAIPFWFLFLSETGNKIAEKMFNIQDFSIGNSFWLIVSFAMSWYTVPLFNWIVSKVKIKGKNV